MKIYYAFAPLPTSKTIPKTKETHSKYKKRTIYMLALYYGKYIWYIEVWHSESRVEGDMTYSDESQTLKTFTTLELFSPMKVDSSG